MSLTTPMTPPPSNPPRAAMQSTMSTPTAMPPGCMHQPIPPPSNLSRAAMQPPMFLATVVPSGCMQQPMSSGMTQMGLATGIQCGVHSPPHGPSAMPRRLGAPMPAGVGHVAPHLVPSQTIPAAGLPPNTVLDLCQSQALQCRLQRGAYLERLLARLGPLLDG